MNRVKQILTKYRIAVLKPGVAEDDEQIDILTDKAGKALLEWLDKEVIGEDESSKVEFGHEKDTFKDMYRNQLRAEIRKKANK